MIRINDKEYSNYSTKVTWGNFEVFISGEKSAGIAPFITFNIEDNIFIGLEFVFSKEMFENTQLNSEINVKKYIGDITFEDEKGWISITTGKYDCNITRISETEFKLELFVESEEIEPINMIIDTKIDIL